MQRPNPTCRPGQLSAKFISQHCGVSQYVELSPNMVLWTGARRLRTCGNKMEDGCQPRSTCARDTFCSKLSRQPDRSLISSCREWLVHCQIYSFLVLCLDCHCEAYTIRSLLLFAFSIWPQLWCLCLAFMSLRRLMAVIKSKIRAFKDPMKWTDDFSLLFWSSSYYNRIWRRLKTLSIC